MSTKPISEREQIAAEYEEAMAQYEIDYAAWRSREDAKIDRNVIAAITELWNGTNRQTRDAMEHLFEIIGRQDAPLVRPDSDYSSDEGYIDDNPMPPRPMEREPQSRIKWRADKKRLAPIVIAEMERIGQKARRMSDTKFEKHFAKLIAADDMYCAFEVYCEQDHRNEDGDDYEFDGDRWKKVRS